MKKLLLITSALVALGGKPAAADPVSFALMANGVGMWSAISASAINMAIVRVVASVAISQLVASVTAPKAPRSASVKTEFTMNGGTNGQRFIVGRYATSGQRVLPPSSWGGNEQYWLDTIAISDMPITRVVQVFYDGSEMDQVADNGDGTTSVGGTYSQRLNGYRLTGTVWDGRQTTPNSYADRMSDKRPWTDDMIGRGTAYATLRMFNRSSGGSATFQGMPSFRFEVEGAALYDPRFDSTAGGSGSQRWADPSTWTFTENPIVIVYNILRGITLYPGLPAWGGDSGAEDLPIDVWFAAMNVCDEDVDDAEGNTVPRYRAGLEIDVANDEPADIIEELLKACGGQIAEVGGTWFVRAGGPGLPVYAFTDDDLLVDVDHDFTPFPGLAETYNTVNASYPSPGAQWESRDAPPVSDPAYVAEDGGRHLPVDLALPSVWDAQQVGRLQAALLRDNRRWRRHSISLGPYASHLMPLDVVAWTSPRNGYDGKAFEIAQTVVASSTLLTGWEIREIDPDDYDWSSDVALPDPVSDTSPLPVSTGAVAGFAVAGTVLQDGEGRPRRPAIQVTWALSDGSGETGTEYVDGVDSLQIQYRRVGEAEQREAVATQPTAGGMILAGDLLPAQDYEVRARYQRVDVEHDWTIWQPVTTPDVRLGVADFPDDFDWSGMEMDIRSLFEEAGMYAIEDVATAAEFPATPAYDGQAFFNREDGRLYFWDEATSAWKAATADVDSFDFSNLTGQAIEAQIADAAISTAKFAAGIEPVTIVTSLPTAKATETVFFNGQLYRWNGSTYVKTIDAADIAGNFSAAQLSAIQLQQLGGQITSVQITDGLITAPKIAAGAVGAEAIAAGSITAGKIVVGDFSNLIPDPSFQDFTVATWEQGTNDWQRVPSPGVGGWGLGVRQVAQYIVPDASDAWGVPLSSAFIPEVEPGKWYFLSGKISFGDSASQGKSGRMLIRLSFLDRTGSEIANLYALDGTITLGNATEYSATVQAPADAAFVRWQCFVRRGDFGTGARIRVGTPVVRKVMDAEMIVDGSITSDSLSANSVTAGKVAAGAISAQELAVGVGRNWLGNANFADDDIWSLGYRSGNGGIGAATSLEWRGPGNTWSGADYRTLMMFQSDTATDGYCDFLMRPIGGDDGAGRYGWPATYGQRIQAFAHVSRHRCTVEIRLHMMDKDGATLGYRGPVSFGPNSGSSDNPEDWEKIGLITTIDQPDCAYVRWHFRKLGTESGDNSYVFIHKPFFGEAGPSQTEYSPWDAGEVTKIGGGRIVTNAIVARHLTAREITAAKIAVGTITGNEIAANTITGNKIVANTITAGLLATSGLITNSAQINNGLITNAKIANGAIDNAKIGTAEIDELKLASGAVTVQNSAGTDTVLSGGSSVTAMSMTLNIGSGGAQSMVGALVFRTRNSPSSYSDQFTRFAVFINGALHFKWDLGDLQVNPDQRLIFVPLFLSSISSSLTSITVDFTLRNTASVVSSSMWALVAKR